MNAEHPETTTRGGESSRTFSVRRALPEDAATLAILAITVWVDTYAVDALPGAWASYLEAAYTKEALAAALSDPARSIWVAENEAGALGFAELLYDSRRPELEERRQAEVVHLYVLERFARRGIGRALLDECVRESASRGVETLWLAAYAENRRALEFYRALGWREAGITSFELGGVEYPNVVLAQSPAPAS